MKNSIITLVLLLVASITYGQDKIIKKNLDEILCKVQEIGSTEIKYKKWDNLEGPIYTIKKSEVLKIEFENGSVELIEQNEMAVTPGKNRTYKRAITTRPFSLLGGHLCLGYQQAIHPTRSIVAEAGFIGPGIGTLYNPASGGYVRVGLRLKRSPEVIMEGQEWGHNLGGFYIQPEFAFSTFDRESTDWSTGAKRTYHYNSGALMITFGRQMIAGDIMTFDLGTSIGYAFTSSDNPNNDGIDSPRYYSHNSFGTDMPLAWNFTLSIGFLMK